MKTSRFYLRNPYLQLSLLSFFFPFPSSSLLLLFSLSQRNDLFLFIYFFNLIYIRWKTFNTSPAKCNVLRIKGPIYMLHAYSCLSFTHSSLPILTVVSPKRTRPISHLINLQRCGSIFFAFPLIKPA